MKKSKSSRKSKGVVKGIPSAVVLSILIHAGVLVVATTFVVFKAVYNPPVKFDAPPTVVRPKIDVKRPTVKIKKTVNPGAPEMITTDAAVTGFPEMKLSSVPGMGQEIGDGVGGFDMMPELGMMPFGVTNSLAVGNDFEGTFYALDYGRDGQLQDMEQQEYVDLASKFAHSGFSEHVFLPYYRSPTKLYTTQFMIPWTTSEFGPSAFGISEELGVEYNPKKWMIHYKGKIRSKEGGTYRLWSAADDHFFAMVDGVVVLNGTWSSWNFEEYPWEPPEEHFRYPMQKIVASVGHWFTLEPGEIVPMEILMGEINGGNFCCTLLIENKAESNEYPLRDDGMPILPVFKTAEMPHVVKAELTYRMIRDECDLGEGPIFNVY